MVERIFNEHKNISKQSTRKQYNTGTDTHLYIYVLTQS